MDLKGVLNADGVQEEAERFVAEQGRNGDEDDEADQLAGVVQEMLKRGKQPNLSFFAFTATPKYKTKKVFDEPGPSGEAPFHLYTMRQAIEERFILDVLRHYITYDAYFRLVQVGNDDPHAARKKATRALARTLTFHGVNLLRGHPRRAPDGCAAPLSAATPDRGDGADL
jgi:type I restriction enzyme R subunit